MHLEWGVNMKNIKVIKEDREQKIFSIAGYSFFEEEASSPSIPIFKLVIHKRFSDQLDFKYWIEEISEKIHYLNAAPSEVTEYIKQYEENIRFSDGYLFHDIRTKFIDFILFDDVKHKHNVVLLGYSLLELETCLAIKAFNMDGLSEFSNQIIDYCAKNEIQIESETNLRWLQIEQCILPNTNYNRNDVFDSFLKKTLDTEYFNTFVSAFKKIDYQGYFDKSFYSSSITINGHQTEVGNVKQFRRYFTPFWKTEISVKELNRTVLYLHDELLNDESLDKMVYTIKPHLMQYYQLHWFEDFCFEVISNIDTQDFYVANIYPGRKFNFFQSGKSSDIREIDVLLGVICNGVYKIIAIECKKTLSNDEIKDTNNKTREKVLKANLNVIDAYIHIGCFNNDVVFDRDIENSSEKYKQGLIQLSNSDVNDAPYFAYTVSSIEDLKLKTSYVIKEVFKQW